MLVGIATLLYSADYLPGAFTLAFRVRELLVESREHRLVLLATPEVLDNVSEDVLRALHELYDEVIRLAGDESASKTALARHRTNLAALGRPELADTFHKLQLWKLTQFRKVLYLDCDAFPLHSGFLEAVDQVPDQAPRQLAAVPDCGWPDLFNSGVMVLVPSLAVHGELAAHVETALSIDGADQGLLNLFFNRACHRGTLPNEWRTLPFLYNVTVPNAGYQATPALDYFRRRIAVVHFIGHEKPWISRGVSDSFRELWWQTYNRFLARHFSCPAFSTGNASEGPDVSAPQADGTQSWAPAPESRQAARAFAARPAAPAHDPYSSAPVCESHAGTPVYESHAGAPAFESHSGAPAFESHSGAPAYESHAGAPAAEQQPQAYSQSWAPLPSPQPPAPAPKTHLWTPMQEPQLAVPSCPEPLPSAPCAWDGTKEPPSKDAPPEAYKLALVGTYSWSTASPTLVPEDALLAESASLGSPFHSCKSTDKLPLCNPSPGPPRPAPAAAPRPPGIHLPAPAAPARPRPVRSSLQPAPELLRPEPPAVAPAAASSSAAPAPPAAPAADPAPTEAPRASPAPAAAAAPPLFPWERYKPKSTRVFPE
ncbi:ACR254Cp [Eremothecium gossypii ATCC 10895]|uniref:glycogenin glucosyltransferase n=1 Tax=Eremothecium gossypii (strain ATCC 10895 / CBS 109.51 / FGSC 9923 / NRRL Y-1056) TaxID=284811 RepID=Q75BL7_EREGS|nr:ACR254Cp [Eremothecium gossypii ATCC 10895]AAS51480.1 ACR254Cp [Eremothecium gossypii ATCC 10895]